MAPLNHEFSGISSIRNSHHVPKIEQDMMSEMGNHEIKELIDHMQTHLYRPMAQQEKLIKALKELVFEDKEILEYFSSKLVGVMSSARKTGKLGTLSQLFEAWVYEHRLRIKEKVKKLAELEGAFEVVKGSVRSSDELTQRLQNEIHLYKQLNEIKVKRQFGNMQKTRPEPKNAKTRDVYDWIVDIDMLTNINTAGWKVKFSDQFLQTCSQTIKNHIIGSLTLKKGRDYDAFDKNENLKESPRKNQDQFEDSALISKPHANLSHNQSVNHFYDDKAKQARALKHQAKGTWEGAIVSVVGLYDKGKTFVLNNLAESNLPSGKKLTTAGLSFKYVDVEKGTKLILLDTAGSYSPVKITNECSIIEKEATEMFILDLVFDVSDYFIFVVNDFTSLDQRYLDKLTRSLQSSADKSFREVIGTRRFGC